MEPQSTKNILKGLDEAIAELNEVKKRMEKQLTVFSDEPSKKNADNDRGE